MSKIQKLTGILISLILVSAALFVFDGKTVKQSFEKDMFAIDTARIVSIKISQPQQEINIVKEKQGWRLNDRYLADAYMIRTIKGVLQLVSVKRSVSSIDHESIKTDIESRGAKIEVGLEGGEKRLFFSVGTINQQNTFFGTEDLSQIFSVEIPGYSAYVAQYFESPVNQWRDRVLFKTHWRSLQSLKIDYKDQRDLDIRFVDKFFQLRDVGQVDTANLIGYLSSYQYFQINDFLTPGTYPRYDSLFETEPIAKLDLVDINQDNSRSLTIYQKIPGQRFYLIGNQEREMMVIDEGRMSELLKINGDFEAK